MVSPAATSSEICESQKGCTAVERLGQGSSFQGLVLLFLLQISQCHMSSVSHGKLQYVSYVGRMLSRIASETQQRLLFTHTMSAVHSIADVMSPCTLQICPKNSGKVSSTGRSAPIPCCYRVDFSITSALDLYLVPCTSIPNEQLSLPSPPKNKGGMKGLVPAAA